MINGPFYTYRYHLNTHFTSENASFLPRGAH